LGRTEEVIGEDQQALQQYLLAEKIDPNSVETRLCIARILLKTNQPGLAVDQLSAAVQAEPRNAEAHHQYGRALEALGNLPQAKSEYQESLLLDGENAFTLLHLAQLLEKLGDWPGAMENYRSAAKRVEASLQSARGPQQVVDAPGEYQKAQARLNQHLTHLKAAGKSSEAAELQAQIAAAQASLGTSGELDAAMEAGSRAYMEQKFEDAEKSFKEAVRLAESIHPCDQRLVMALGFLGTLYHNRKDDADAERTFEEQLKVAEEVYGEVSPKICPVLQTLVRFYLERGDAPRAESFAQQELTLAEKNAGNDNFSYSMGLMSVGYVYLTEKQYAKAEPYIQKAVNIHEQLTGPQRMILVSSKKMLCTVYDGLSQTDKAEPCYRQLLPLMEQVYGANSQALAPVLTGESQALRALGRTAEADDVDRRMQSLQPIAAGQLPRMVPTH
jgi:tetratricopeptide (TPR) repeat protein